VEHLKKTHHRLYEKIRENHPDIPYFMVTRPNFYFNEDHISRRDIVMQSYLAARDKGDKNVYFIDGETLLKGEFEESCTIEGCHPNDIGFLRMSRIIGDKLNEIMNLK
jgi:hypothetical protein